MSFLNLATREINCKVVYYGPGLCGKTTNLQYVYTRANPEVRGKLISLETDTERTLFFDFLPDFLESLSGGFKIRCHLYTVPGPVFYDSSRQLVLKGVDGVVFVADSQRARMEANLESLDSLVNLLEAQGSNLAEVPLVLQYNKRDLPTSTLAPVEEMDELLQDSWSLEWLRFEAVATQGVGVFETFEALSRLLRDTIRWSAP